MQQTSVKEKSTGKIFNLELVYSNLEKKHNAVFISSDYIDHKLVNEISKNNFELVSGSLSQLVAKDIDANELKLV